MLLTEGTYMFLSAVSSLEFALAPTVSPTDNHLSYAAQSPSAALAVHICVQHGCERCGVVFEEDHTERQMRSERCEWEARHILRTSKPFAIVGMYYVIEVRFRNHIATSVLLLLG